MLFAPCILNYIMLCFQNQDKIRIIIYEQIDIKKYKLKNVNNIDIKKVSQSRLHSAKPCHYSLFSNNVQPMALN